MEISIVTEQLYMIVNNILRNHRDNVIEYMFEDRRYNDQEKIERFIDGEYQLVRYIKKLQNLHRRIRNSNNSKLKAEMTTTIHEIITIQVRKVTGSKNDVS